MDKLKENAPANLEVSVHKIDMQAQMAAPKCPWRTRGRMKEPSNMTTFETHMPQFELISQDTERSGVIYIKDKPSRSGSMDKLQEIVPAVSEVLPDGCIESPWRTRG